MQSSVHLIGGNDDEVASFDAHVADGKCIVCISYRDRIVEKISSDYFDALCLVRSELETDGLIPFCYGASLNVYPSGMCRDMGSGMLAYRLTLGKHTSRSDLVKIFDEGPDVIPASVELQRRNYASWLQSIGAAPKSEK